MPIRTLLSILLLLLYLSPLFSQEDSPSEPEEEIFLELRVGPLSEAAFETFKAQQKDFIQEDYAHPPDTLRVLSLLGYDAGSLEEVMFSYSWVGYLPLLQAQLVNICSDGACSLYALDPETGRVKDIPADFDQGVQGLLLSPDEKQLLVYSSYDGPDYSYAYSIRASFSLFSIEAGDGLAGLYPAGRFETLDWSIEEVVWIDDHTVGLKVYEENRPQEGNEKEYAYIRGEWE